MIETISIQTEFYEKVLLTKVNNILTFTLNFKQKYYKDKISCAKLKKYFLHTYVIFFFRIIWRGKAYRVRFFKKSNKFTFNFGHSHWNKLIYSPEYTFIKLGRQNYIIIFKTRLQINYVLKTFNTLRVMSRYTKRGIRIKQSPYIRRFGKISQVNSSLHSFG